MKNYMLIITMTVLLTGCYDDRALLTSPNIHPVENAEDKVATKVTEQARVPLDGYNRYNNGYYYYDNGYYYDGYYYCGRRHTRSSRICDDELVGSNGPLSYQNSREGMAARQADGL